MRVIMVALAVAAAGVASTGCSQTCHTDVSNTATAQRTAFEGEVESCNSQSVCAPLCRDVFQIDQTDIMACEITKLDPSTFTVRVVVNDAARCEAGADDVYLGWGDDEGYEDDSGCDDGSCSSDDSGYEDESGDDGSTDSGDDGGDGGDDGGDDGDAIHFGPHHVAPKLNAVPVR